MAISAAKSVNMLVVFSLYLASPVELNSPKEVHFVLMWKCFQDFHSQDFFAYCEYSSIVGLLI